MPPVTIVPCLVPAFHPPCSLAPALGRPDRRWLAWVLAVVLPRHDPAAFHRGFVLPPPWTSVLRSGGRSTSARDTSAAPHELLPSFHLPWRSLALATAPGQGLQPPGRRSRCSVSSTPTCGATPQLRRHTAGEHAPGAFLLAFLPCSCQLPLRAAQQGVEADTALGLLAWRPCLRSQSRHALFLHFTRRAA